MNPGATWPTTGGCIYPRLEVIIQMTKFTIKEDFSGSDCGSLSQIDGLIGNRVRSAVYFNL